MAAMFCSIVSFLRLPRPGNFLLPIIANAPYSEILMLGLCSMMITCTPICGKAGKAKDSSAEYRHLISPLVGLFAKLDPG